MILSIDLGFDYTDIPIIWNKDLNDFPRVVEYRCEKWEWFMYDEGVHPVDFVLKYAQVPLYSPDYLIDAPKLEDFMAEVVEIKCECGAEATNGKNTLHSTWCKKWRP
jgi:hypothetical protein